MMKIGFTKPLAVSSASSRLRQEIQSEMVLGFEVTTILTLFGNGLEPMDSHVRRPIIIVVFVVILRKYFISGFNDHGIDPFRPIPFSASTHAIMNTILIFSSVSSASTSNQILDKKNINPCKISK